MEGKPAGFIAEPLFNACGQRTGRIEWPKGILSRLWRARALEEGLPFAFTLADPTFRRLSAGGAPYIYAELSVPGAAETIRLQNLWDAMRVYGAVLAALRER